MYVRTRRSGGAPAGGGAPRAARATTDASDGEAAVREDSARGHDASMFSSDHAATAQFHRVHSGISEQWAASQWAKPRWWFVVRRYFFALSMVARMLCTCVVVASGIAVCMLHVPIYASLDAIEHVYVPSFVSVRYDLGTATTTTATAMAAGTLVSRYPNGTADVGGAFHAALVHLRDEPLWSLSAAAATPVSNNDTSPEASSICATEATESANHALSQLYASVGMAEASNVVGMACRPAFMHPMTAGAGAGGQSPQGGWAVGCQCVPVVVESAFQLSVDATRIMAKRRWSMHFVATPNATESMGAAVLSVSALFPTQVMVAPSGELVLVGTNVSSAAASDGGAFASASAVDLILLRVAAAVVSSSSPAGPIDGGAASTVVVEFYAAATVLQSVWHALTGAFDSATITAIEAPPQDNDDGEEEIRTMALAAFASATLGQVRILRVSWAVPSLLLNGGGYHHNLSASVVTAALVGVTSMPPGSGSGVCCGSAPLFLLAAQASLTTAASSSAAGGSLSRAELLFLVYRSCPSQCTQTMYRDGPEQGASTTTAQEGDDEDATPCYSTRLSTFKYSLDYGLFSALLPISLSNRSVMRYLDAVADRVVFGGASSKAVQLALVQSTDGATTTVLLRIADAVASRVAVFAFHWVGGYRVEGVVATVHGNGHAVDVAVAGRMALHLLTVDGQRAYVALLATNDAPHRLSPPVGALVCVGPASRSILVADNGGFPSSTAVADGGHCFGRVISTEDFILR